MGYFYHISSHLISADPLVQWDPVQSVQDWTQIYRAHDLLIDHSLRYVDRFLFPVTLNGAHLRIGSSLFKRTEWIGKDLLHVVCSYLRHKYYLFCTRNMAFCDEVLGSFENTWVDHARLRCRRQDGGVQSHFSDSCRNKCHDSNHRLLFDLLRETAVHHPCFAVNNVDDNIFVFDYRSAADTKDTQVLDWGSRRSKIDGDPLRHAKPFYTCPTAHRHSRFYG